VAELLFRLMERRLRQNLLASSHPGVDQKEEDDSQQQDEENRCGSFADDQTTPVSYVPTRFRSDLDTGYLPSSSTLKLLVTEKTLGTLLAWTSAICLSICRATTPSSVTCPLFTMM
jgi:hypothetical protein